MHGRAAALFSSIIHSYYCIVGHLDLSGTDMTGNIPTGVCNLVDMQNLTVLVNAWRPLWRSRVHLLLRMLTNGSLAHGEFINL